MSETSADHLICVKHPSPFGVAFAYRIAFDLRVALGCWAIGASTMSRSCRKTMNMINGCESSLLQEPLSPRSLRSSLKLPRPGPSLMHRQTDSQQDHLGVSRIGHRTRPTHVQAWLADYYCGRFYRLKAISGCLFHPLQHGGANASRRSNGQGSGREISPWDIRSAHLISPSAYRETAFRRSFFCLVQCAPSYRATPDAELVCKQTINSDLQ
jgi:hypothetical protein